MILIDYDKVENLLLDYISETARDELWRALNGEIAFVFPADDEIPFEMDQTPLWAELFDFKDMRRWLDEYNLYLEKHTVID